MTLNLGVRWDVDTLIQGDHNNVAPRVGFAWNVGSTGKTVIRGNTGIFYDTLESSLINRESNFGPVGQAALDLRQGDPLFPTFPNRPRVPDRGRDGAALDGHVPVYEGDDFPLGISDTLQRVAPYFFNTTIGFQRELGPNWAVSADYVRVVRYDMLVTLDINAPPYFPLGPGQTRTVAQANLLRPLGVPNRTGGPYNSRSPASATCSSSSTAARRSTTRSSSASRGARRPATRCGSLYTYSKARGDVDNFRLTESFVPGQTEIDGDRSYQQGPSANDTPHLFALNGTYELPFGLRPSGILFSRSGFPYTGGSRLRLRR